MQSDNWTDITRQSFSALRSRKIIRWLLSIHFDYAISEIYVGSGVFVWKFAAEEFRQTLHLQLMDLVKVEPSTATGNDKSSVWVFLDTLFNELFLSCNLPPFPLISVILILVSIFRGFVGLNQFQSFRRIHLIVDNLVPMRVLLESLWNSIQIEHPLDFVLLFQFVQTCFFIVSAIDEHLLINVWSLRHKHI